MGFPEKGKFPGGTAGRYFFAEKNESLSFGRGKSRRSFWIPESIENRRKRKLDCLKINKLDILTRTVLA
jgi:hypothetical protein